MTSDPTHKHTSSPAAASGPSQPGSPDGPTPDLFGPPPARASRSRKPGSNAVLLMNGICGPTYSDSCAQSGPLFSWENRLRERLGMVGSTESALIWREKVTPAGRSISRLAPWTPPTSGTGSTGSRWPSPTSSVGGVEPEGATGRKLQTHMVRSEPGRWPTPNCPTGGRTMTFEEAVTQRKRTDGSKAQLNLENAMLHLAGWSTPRASDGEKGGPNQSFGAGGTPLPSQMHRATWVTPSTRDWKDSPGMATQREDGRSRLDQLPRQMAATWPTPRASDNDQGPTNREKILAAGSSWLGQNRGATLSTALHMAHSGPTPNGSSATTEKRGAPNPDFACWLMGFPDEWIAGVSRAMRSYRSSRRRSSKP